MGIELKAVAITIGVITVALIVLAINGLVGGEWNTIAVDYTSVSVILAFFGVSMTFLAYYVRR